MNEILNNPVFHALRTRDASFALGTENVKYFPEEISPFAGFPSDHKNGFAELHQLLPPGRKILYATRKMISEPEGWQLNHEIHGLQFVFDGERPENLPSDKPVKLEPKHAAEMVALAQLTKPGPFDMRTIEFGSYYGIFENEKLVAMTGQRLHLPGMTEISAVCTHPDHTGKGYAAILFGLAVNIILNSGDMPFLHVRADNARAIELYKRFGFKENGGMNFYFMKRR